MEIKKNHIFETGKRVEVQTEAKQAPAEKADAPAVQPETKELGAKLLEQPYVGRELVKSAVAKEDAAELAKLFALAGIKAAVPSKEVYARIAADTTSAEKRIDDLATTNNMEEFFTKGTGRLFI